MEDFVLDQARYFARILAANAKHMEEKHVVLKQFSVQAVPVMDQAQTLQVAVRDSVMLHKDHSLAHDFIVAKSDFSLHQNRLIGVALEDRARLQDTAENGEAEVQLLRPQFVLEVAKTLESIVRDNAEAALRGNVDISKLEMCQPWEVANLVRRYCQLVEYHIHHLAALTQSVHNADKLTTQLRAENENVTAQCSNALARTIESEEALIQSRNEFERVKTILEAELATRQNCIDKVKKEHEKLQSAHDPCANKLQERDCEIAQLKEECKKLIRDHQERTEAANDRDAKVAIKTEELEQVHMERDKLATELSELKTSYKQLRLQRAEETEQLVQEAEQLRQTLQSRVSALEAMEDKNTQLRRTVSQLESELRAIATQLTSSEIQCDTWKSMFENLMATHTADLDAAHTVAIQERESREAGDVLLQNAAHKIEVLEQKHREKDEEIARLRETIAQKTAENNHRLPISPPPSVHRAGQSASRKRKAAGKVSASWSQDDKGFALNLAAHGSPTPPERAAVLANLPPVVVSLGEGGTPEIFTRQSLSNILGGSLQGLVVRCTNSATELARRYEITDYLCPNMDHNAWSPPGPGQHGYMQVGLGRDRKLFNGEGEYRHVFVGGGRFLLYCGWYHVLRVDPLTKEEWDTLPPKVKTTYSETTFNKENTRESTNKELWSTIKNADQVLAMYNTGELRAPLVRLQCIQFDMDFYQELVDANGRYFTNKQRPAPPSAAKRRRIANDPMVEDDDKEEDVPMALVDDKAEDDQLPSPLESTTPAAPSSEDALAQNSGRSASTEAPHAVGPPTPVSLAGANIVLPPSSPIRHGGLIRLRIPGGRSPRSCTDSKDTEEEGEVEDGLSSMFSSPLPSLSPPPYDSDDDLYAD